MKRKADSLETAKEGNNQQIVYCNEDSDERLQPIEEDPPNKQKWYECPSCPYKTKRKHDLPKHLLVHDNDVIRYKCSLCSYETKRKNDMPKHMLTHCDKGKHDFNTCCNTLITYNFKVLKDLNVPIVRTKQKERMICQSICCAIKQPMK